MIITNQFVLINYPKTGTTFARSAISAVYGIKNTRFTRLLRKLGIQQTALRELTFPKLYGDYDPSYRDQHGVYRQIPDEDRSKRIVSIVRNPLYKYRSSYVYGWWKKHPPYALEEVLKDFPTFPEISFSQFYDLLNHPRVSEDRISVPEARSIGNYTRMFLVFYAEDPDSAASAVITGEPLARVVPRITFLHQETLRDELVAFLKQVGIAEAKAKRVYRLEARNVSSQNEKSGIPKDEIKSVSTRILSDERHFLEVFPEYREQLNQLAESGVIEAREDSIAEPRTLGG
ncbi:MAG: hypothetical protein AAF750_05995 [Planctomycetota bacterium]